MWPSKPLTLNETRRARACPAVLPARTPVGPVRGAAADTAGIRADPSAGLPPPPNPGPGGLRAHRAGPGTRLRLRADLQPRLLGPHHPAPPQTLGADGDIGTSSCAGAGSIRSHDRPR